MFVLIQNFHIPTVAKRYQKQTTSHQRLGLGDKTDCIGQHNI